MSTVRQNRRHKISPRSRGSHCVICGSTDRVERHHIGGRHHVVWITAPFCLKHHNEFHLRLRLAGIDLRYTSNEQERHRRARQAIFVVLSMLENHRKNRKPAKRKGSAT